MTRSHSSDRAAVELLAHTTEAEWRYITSRMSWRFRRGIEVRISGELWSTLQALVNKRRRMIRRASVRSRHKQRANRAAYMASYMKSYREKC